LSEQAAETAAGAWPEYSRRVVEDRAQILVEWAEQAGEAVTAGQLVRFLRDGAEQNWIRRGVDRGRIGSGLHVWTGNAGSTGSEK
jgi:hypothetical protein